MLDNIYFVFQVKQNLQEVFFSFNLSLSLFCLFNFSTCAELSNTALFRNSADGESMVLSACFEEEVTYMFCSIRFFRFESIHFSFSTVAPVRSYFPPLNCRFSEFTFFFFFSFLFFSFLFFSFLFFSSISK